MPISPHLKAQISTKQNDGGATSVGNGKKRKYTFCNLQSNQDTIKKKIETKMKVIALPNMLYIKFKFEKCYWHMGTSEPSTFRFLKISKSYTSMTRKIMASNIGRYI
jgi:hypothetical protein